jgi:hypothetical protein
VAEGDTTLNEIEQRTGLPDDNALREKLQRLQSLGYLSEMSNHGRARTAACRYAVADPAHRFHLRFVEPNTSIIERFGAKQVWNVLVKPHLDTYMWHVFERIVEQAYSRFATVRNLPLLRERSRWEGSVRDGVSA